MKKITIILLLLATQFACTNDDESTQKVDHYVAPVKNTFFTFATDTSIMKISPDALQNPIIVADSTQAILIPQIISHPDGYDIEQNRFLLYRKAEHLYQLDLRLEDIAKSKQVSNLSSSDILCNLDFKSPVLTHLSDGKAAFGFAGQDPNCHDMRDSLIGTVDLNLTANDPPYPVINPDPRPIRGLSMAGFDKYQIIQYYPASQGPTRVIISTFAIENGNFVIYDDINRKTLIETANQLQIIGTLNTQNVLIRVDQTLYQLNYVTQELTTVHDLVLQLNSNIVTGIKYNSFQAFERNENVVYFSDAGDIYSVSGNQNGITKTKLNENKLGDPNFILWFDYYNDRYFYVTGGGTNYPYVLLPMDGGTPITLDIKPEFYLNISNVGRYVFSNPDKVLVTDDEGQEVFSLTGTDALGINWANTRPEYSNVPAERFMFFETAVSDTESHVRLLDLIDGSIKMDFGVINGTSSNAPTLQFLGDQTYVLGIYDRMFLFNEQQSGQVTEIATTVPNKRFIDKFWYL